MHPPENKILNFKISVNLDTHIGKGSTGDVYKGLSLQPLPHPIAVKAIPLQQINNEVTAYLLQCELEALKAVSSPENQTIVRLEDIIVIDGYCYIAMELLEGGTLKSYIAEMKTLDQEQAFFILRRILEGYKILKDHGIIHRDLKPDNIIFQHPPNDVLTPKIIDFGYCEVERVSNRPKGYYNVGSPRYMSPQAYQGNQYSQKSDIWSIGIIFYEMLTGTNFDKGMNIIETFQMIKEKGIPIPYSLSDKAKRLLQGMLMISPQNRMNCDQALQGLHFNENPNPERMNPEQVFPEPKINLISQERMFHRQRGHKRKIEIVSMPEHSIRAEMATHSNMNSVMNLKRMINKPVAPGGISPPKVQTDAMYQSIIHQNNQLLSASTSEKNLNVIQQKQQQIKTFSDKNSPHPGIEIQFSKPPPKERDNSFSFKVYRAHNTNQNANNHRYLQAPRTRMPITPPLLNQRNQMLLPNKGSNYRQPNTNFTFCTPKKIQFQRRDFLNHSERLQPQNGLSDAQVIMRKTINPARLINPNSAITIAQVNQTQI